MRLHKRRVTVNELISSVEDKGARQEWWVGDGCWWLFVEGFGLVKVYYLFKEGE